MREPIRDKERLEHISKAIQIIISRKDFYYSIKPSQLWRTIVEDIPLLQPKIALLLEKYTD